MSTGLNKPQEEQAIVEPLYTAEFLAKVNNHSDQINEKNDYVNEFFLYFVVSNFENLRQTANQNNEVLDRPGRLWVYLKSAVHGVYLFFSTLFYLVAMSCYVLLKFRRGKKEANPTQSLAVIRSPATYSKMAFLEKEGVLFYEDSFVYDVSDSDLSLYAQSFFTRLTGVFLIAALGVKDFISLFLMAHRHLGFVTAVSVINYYSKRLAHKVTFEFYLSRLLKKIKPEIFYTGNKEDRFALTEKRLCNELGIKIVCIPHGLEYAFKMPGGLAGDVFYCNSLYAKDYLRNLYDDTCTVFVFDRNVVKQMFSRHVEPQKQSRIVFFPESREPEKNFAIIEFLKKQGIDFFVKIHGKDNLDNYRTLIDESWLIDDFNQAISNSICLARKSTVLLEAIYNHSTPIAILVDDKDRSYFEFMFPSLKDESILKVYSFDELKSLVEKLRTQNVQ
jgi:hypothetical protein